MTDIGGIPAKLIKMRFTEEEIKEHERMLDVKCVKYYETFGSFG